MCQTENRYIPLLKKITLLHSCKYTVFTQNKPLLIDDGREGIKSTVNPYPMAFPYGNGMVLHFYQQQESSTTKTVHRVINKGLKMYV